MKKAKAGFSLIEILISMAIVAVVFPAVVALYSLSTYTTSQGETFTKAFALAQSEMESYYSQRKAAGWNSISTGSSSSKKGIFDVQNNVSLINADEKEVQIFITWNERGSTQNFMLESIIANIK